MSGALQAVSMNMRSSAERIWLAGTAAGVSYDNRASNAAGVYQGNAVFGGSYKLSGNNKPALALFNTSGALQWSKYLSRNNNTIGQISSTFFDTSGNLYATGVEDDLTTGILYKFNSAGTALGEYKIDLTYGFSSGVTDSSGNIYLVGAKLGCLVVMKLNSSFVIQWQKGYTITGPSPNASPRKITVDSSGNVYATFFYFTDGSDIYQGNPAVIKYNSSGTFQWIRTVNGNGLYKYVQNAGGVTVDSSGNVYYIHTVYNTSFNNPVVTKFNSSGTWQWSKSNSGGNYGYSMAIDSSDNIYFAQGSAVYKMNTSGTGTGGIISNQEMGNLYLDAGTGTGGSLYVGGWTEYGWMAYKLPISFAVTGTYTVGSIIVSLTSVSNTLIDIPVSVSTPSFTNAATSHTISASGASFTDAGFTATTISLN